MKILIIVLVKVGQERILTEIIHDLKKGDVTRILGCGLWSYSDILVEAHPHIGTNKLPKLFRIFGKIIECGGHSKLE
jgi:hypothetical protein